MYGQTLVKPVGSKLLLFKEVIIV